MPPSTLQPVGSLRRIASPFLFQWEPVRDGVDGNAALFDRVALNEATTTRGGTVGTATAVDAAGLVYLAGSQQARFHHLYNNTTGAWDPVGVRVDGSRKNLALQPENFGTTWAAVGTPTRTAAAGSCGVVSLDLLSDADAGTLDGYSQTITFTGNAVKSIAVFFRQGTSTTSVIRLRDTTAGADRLLVAITWNAGIPVVTMTTGTNVLAAATLPCERLADAAGNAVWRVLLNTTAVTAANTNSLQIYPATTAALAVATMGTLYVGGVQAEDALYPGAYIPQTNAALTRSADACNFPCFISTALLTWLSSFRFLGAGVALKWEYGATAYYELAVTTAGAVLSHYNGAATVTSTVNTTLTVSDFLEARLLLGADGSVNLGLSKNGGAEALGGASAAQAFQAAQASPVVRVADTSLVADFALAHTSLRALAGTQVLATMQAA